MNFNRILKMLTAVFLRRAVNRSIRKAVGPARGAKPADGMSPQERAQTRTARQTAKRARQAARITRRMGR